MPEGSGFVSVDWNRNAVRANTKALQGYLYMLTLDNSLDNVDTFLVYSIANRKQCSVVLRRGIIVVLGIGEL